MSHLPTKTRLKRTGVFREISQRGSWVHSRLLSLGVIRHEGAGVRYGIRFKRGLSRAVDRNRLKRQLREAIRREELKIAKGTDLVAVIHPQAHPSSSIELNRHLKRLCLKQSILVSEKA